MQVSGIDTAVNTLLEAQMLFLPDPPILQPANTQMAPAPKSGPKPERSHCPSQAALPSSLRADCGQQPTEVGGTDIGSFASRWPTFVQLTLYTCAVEYCSHHLYVAIEYLK